MRKNIVLDKQVGETPLACVEKWREQQTGIYQTVPLSYAGRLDPMASGKLLVLIGEECKNQKAYHNLDKEYEFSILLGVNSDSGDVLGNISATPVKTYNEKDIRSVIKGMIGSINLPYPKFSSKTVLGKPLHTWTIEDRLDEIEIPTKQSTIYTLNLINLETISHDEVYKYATEKIETIPPVTELRKAIGNDFRRDDIRASWQSFAKAQTNSDYQIATFRTIVTSGTYMRTLASTIAKELDTTGLAYSIHRTKIGKYRPILGKFGFWQKKYD